MPQIPRQGARQHLLRAWLILTLLFAVMGGVALVYNPMVGAVLLGLCLVTMWRAWRNRHPQTVSLALELQQDPLPGALGGEIGGWLRAGSDTRRLEHGSVTLACVRLCERQRSQIIEHRREVVWQETRPLFTDEQTGALGFCFTPPGHLPPTEPGTEPGVTQWSCRHYWTLAVGGISGGQSASQGFRVIVKPGRETMENPLSDGQCALNEPFVDERPPVEDRLAKRLVIGGDDRILRLHDPIRYRDWQSWMALAGALLLAGVGMNQAGPGAWLLLVVGLWLGGRSVYHLGLALDLELEGRDLRVTSSWFGRPLFLRRGRLVSRDQLVLRPVLASGLCDVVLQGEGRRLLLARGLARDEADALRQLLAQRIMPD